MQIKVMTFNTQHCTNYRTGKIDFEVIAQAIADEAPALVGLNEMYDAGPAPEFEAQAKILAEKAGFPYVYFAKAIDVTPGNSYGNALLSKYPIRAAQTVMIPDPQMRQGTHGFETRCVLKAEIDVAGGLDVFVTHFGLNPSEALNAVSTVLCQVPERRSLLMGDFNLTPENALLDYIRDYLQDAAEGFCAEKQSWPSDAPRMKIDYIFVSRDISVLSADIPAVVASDHRPHTAVLELPEAEA